MFRKIRENRLAKTRALFISVFFGVASVACSPGSNAGLSGTEAVGQSRIFIVGQDLGAIRGFYQSACCVKADGHTAYANLYNVLSESLAYNGLGIDPDGNLLNEELDNGTGPINVRKTAMEFPGGLAVGLELAENQHPEALSHLVAVTTTNISCNWRGCSR